MGVISESHSEPVRPQIPVEKSLRVTAYPNPAAAVRSIGKLLSGRQGPSKSL